MEKSFKEFLDNHSGWMNDYLATFFSPGTHPDMDRYLYQPLARYSANAGKRHRPLLCLLGCASVGGDMESAKTAAAAVEHFHTAALIHDDIADDSLLRRGQPCMHLEQGEGVAINAGDLALSLVTDTILSDDSLDDHTKIRVLNHLVDMTTRTIEGQALDLGWARDKRFDITVDDYFVMAEHKTAFYSGATPLACGAIIGGGSDEQIEALRTFGLLTGLAFQIQDDYLNLIGEEGAALKDFRSDITEGKRTLMAVHALQHSKDSAELEEILGSRTTDAEKLERAVDIMREAGSVDYARDYSFKLIADAKKLLPGLEFDPECETLLYSMADFFVERLV